MELTKEEIALIKKESGFRGVSRANAFVGESITDINDPTQRKLVINEMIKALKQIKEGKSTVWVEEFDD